MDVVARVQTLQSQGGSTGQKHNTYPLVLRHEGKDLRQVRSEGLFGELTQQESITLRCKLEAQTSKENMSGMGRGLRPTEAAP